MTNCELVDTFPAFASYWRKAQGEPVDAQIDSWASGYMSQWAELLDKQLQDYANEEMDWRETARQPVFPVLADRLPALAAAHGNLTVLAKAIYSEAQEVRNSIALPHS